MVGRHTKKELAGAFGCRVHGDLGVALKNDGVPRRDVYVAEEERAWVRRVDCARLRWNEWDAWREARGMSEEAALVVEASGWAGNWVSDGLGGRKRMEALQNRGGVGGAKFPLQVGGAGDDGTEGAPAACGLDFSSTGKPGRRRRATGPKLAARVRASGAGAPPALAAQACPLLPTSEARRGQWGSLPRRPIPSTHHIIAQSSQRNSHANTAPKAWVGGCGTGSGLAGGWRLWGGQARARTSACSSLHGQGVPRSHSWRHVSPTAPCSLLKTKDKPVVGIRARRPRRCISQVHLGSRLGIAASVALVCVPRLDCLRLLASADWDASCPWLAACFQWPHVGARRGHTLRSADGTAPAEGLSDDACNFRARVPADSAAAPQASPAPFSHRQPQPRRGPLDRCLQLSNTDFAEREGSSTSATSPPEAIACQRRASLACIETQRAGPVLVLWLDGLVWWGRLIMRAMWLPAKADDYEDACNEGLASEPDGDLPPRGGSMTTPTMANARLDAAVEGDPQNPLRTVCLSLIRSDGAPVGPPALPLPAGGGSLSPPPSVRLPAARTGPARVSRHHQAPQAREPLVRGTIDA
ncbi:hypothetical protein Purlil1_2926 [Purpureocillium lilacinum]|uniref:Uncharacterized protein n=1 Tax=Purpureocillium lilacinum TaxID=33203 RepID=A0ABR0CAM5_PURLI|nr:hypothetical protein Purlil1_2926 [Purpureocillium lilacinum]